MLECKILLISVPFLKYWFYLTKSAYINKRDTMAKGLSSQKSDKKEPLKTPKEKKAEKLEKKNSKKRY